MSAYLRNQGDFQSIPYKVEQKDFMIFAEVEK